MPSQEIRLSPLHRRTALQVLDRNRLSQLTEQFGLEVEDRRVTENHINALVRSRSVDFAEVLGQLKREELQTICDALGLDRGGREKEVLVQRILGFGQPQQVTLGLQPPPAAPDAEVRVGAAL
jgi:type I restriction enzyme M protein